MKSLIFNSFTIDSIIGGEGIYESLTDTPYADELGFGFENVEFEENVLSATLIKRNMTYIYEYDSQAKEMHKKQIMLFSDIKFQIDLDFNLICVYGQALYLSQLKSAMRNTFNFPFTTTQPNLSPYTIYLGLSAKQVSFTFQSIAIERFVFQNGISGKLMGDVLDNNIALKLLNIYKTDVNKALFQITIDENDSFGLQASNNGAVKFFGPEDMFNYHLSFFKRTLFK